MKPGEEWDKGAKRCIQPGSIAGSIARGIGDCRGAAAALAHLDLRRIRRGALPEASDPRAYRRRLAFTFIFLVPLIVLIGWFHFHDAVMRGESIVPVAAGICIPIGIIAAIFFFAGRRGPGEGRKLSARILRWAVPIAGGIALLRLIAMLCV